MGATQSRHLRLTLATVAHLLLALAISHIDAEGEQRLVEIIDEASCPPSLAYWSASAYRFPLGLRVSIDPARELRAIRIVVLAPEPFDIGGTRICSTKVDRWQFLSICWNHVRNLAKTAPLATHDLCCSRLFQASWKWS
ncbi:hypothetical protein ACIBG0_03370 [Nocardia sp. NPDC050630]|uniref:hypothetical protein n=1 Tax=Nocardia sp. NPDC050630 TaxID=3364321 RepID=UPI00379A353B